MTPEQIVALKARINEVLPTGTGTINAASFRTILNEIIDEVEASDERLEKVLVPYDTGVYLRVFDTDGVQQVEWDFRTDGTLFKNGVEFTTGGGGSVQVAMVMNAAFRGGGLNLAESKIHLCGRAATSGGDDISPAVHTGV